MHARAGHVCTFALPSGKRGSNAKLVSKKPSVKAKRSFGQHFLIEPQISTAIAEQALLSPGDRVLEIGPGTGSLTSEILKRGANVLALEADRSLTAGLKAQFTQEISSGQLSIMEGDATRVDIRRILADGGRTDRAVKVVANLPFNITTAVLRILLPLGDVITDVIVMLQLEAAQRLTGSLPDNSQYRAMSVLVEFYSSAALGMRIDRRAFEPRPHVDCAMAHFKLKRAQDRVTVPSEEAFLRLVNICFSSRRKTVKNSLRAVFAVNAVTAALDSLGLDGNVRPQELQLQDFAGLCEHLSVHA